MLYNHASHGHSCDMGRCNAKMVEKANKISGHISNRIGGPLGGDVRKVAGETDITVVKEDQIMPIQNQLVEQGLAPLNHLCAQSADQYEGFARALSLMNKTNLNFQMNLHSIEKT